MKIAILRDRYNYSHCEKNDTKYVKCLGLCQLNRQFYSINININFLPSPHPMLMPPKMWH